MKKYALVGAVFATFCGTTLAASVPVDCEIPKGGAVYKAEVINDGTMNRSVQITFKAKPTADQATKTVQTCVRAAVAKNGAVDALGSAWVAGKPVALSKGTYFAYFSGEKKYRFM